MTRVLMMALEHVLCCTITYPRTNRKRVTQEFLLNKGTDIDHQEEEVTEFQPLSIQLGSRNNPGDIA
jgi:hypothetical protein